VDRLIALVLMRWRLDLRGLFRARERAFTLLLVVPGMAVFSGLASLFVFGGVRALANGDPRALPAVLSLAATGVGLMWALSPVLAGLALTETHDLSRLLHFPLPLSTLVSSSLLANLVQPMVLAELPVAVALGLAVSTESLALLPLAVLGVLSSLAFILVAAQCTGLLLHALSRNRRLQDLALFLGLGLGFLFSVLPLLLLSGARPLRGLLSTVLRSDLLALSPFGWGVRAAVRAGEGDLPGFLLWEAAQVAAVAAGVGAAAFLVGRVYRGELALGPSRRRAAVRARMRLGGAVGALVEKDLRSAWRDPALKATLLMSLAGPLLFLVFLVQASAYGGAGSSLLMLSAFVGASAFGSNAFGMERRGVAMLMGFPVERWRILVAKNLAALSLRLPGLLVVLAAALFLAPPSYLPAALCVALCTMIVSAAADNYVAILFPVAAPPPGGNPFGGSSAGGRGLGAALMGALLFLGTMLLASPFVLLCWLPVLLEARWLWLVTLPLALFGAAAAYALLVAGAEKLLLQREPEVLERILAEA
jgi:ABC-2 type transport system permease protein